MDQSVNKKAAEPKSSATSGANENSGGSLRDAVHNSVDHFFDNMGRQPVTGLHRIVMREVESTLIANVMRRAGNNQSKAAAMLGLSRGTLRARLKQYDLL